MGRGLHSQDQSIRGTLGGEFICEGSNQRDPPGHFRLNVMAEENEATKSVLQSFLRCGNVENRFSLIRV